MLSGTFGCEDRSEYNMEKVSSNMRLKHSVQGAAHRYASQGCLKSLALLFGQFTGGADQCGLLVFDVFLEHTFLEGRWVAPIIITNPPIEDIQFGRVLSSRFCRGLKYPTSFADLSHEHQPLSASACCLSKTDVHLAFAQPGDWFDRCSLSRPKAFYCE